MSRVVLDSKYGVNPSVGYCFWCGESSEVILFGHIGSTVARSLGVRPGAEAPRSVILSSTPCQACEKSAADGYVTIRCVPDATMEVSGVVVDERIRIDENLGLLAKAMGPMIWRLKVEVAREIFGETIERNRFLLLQDSVIDHIGLPRNEGSFTETTEESEAEPGQGNSPDEVGD